MYQIFKIFQELKKKSQKNGDSYNIAALPLVRNHKIGVSHTQQPMFFIKCEDPKSVKTIDSHLEFISVQYNRECQLKNSKDKIEEGIYAIISLKTDSIDLQEYFLEMVYIVIKNLAEIPKLQELKLEIEKLINLFSKFSSPPIKTIQGLWAEILIIERSNRPDYLIQAWHSAISDKFDFNDGVDKIEVKSTSKNRRIHTFSIEQLNPNKNSNLIIASVFAVETGVGKNIFDLIDLIVYKLKEKSLLFRVNEIIAATLGKDFEKAFDVFYDYHLAIDTLKYYEFSHIPSINFNDIPREITNVRFDSDLTNIHNIIKCNNKSVLHNSLFQK